MSTKFINLKPDKRIEVVSIPALLSFIFFMFLDFSFLAEDTLILALLLLPILGGLSLVIFQGKKPFYWLKFFLFYTRTTVYIPNFKDTMGEVKLKDILAYKNALKKRL